MTGRNSERYSNRSNDVLRLGGQSAVVLLGAVFTLLAGWPLQIFVIRMIGANGFGIFSLLESITMMVAGLFGLGLAPTVVRFIPEYLETGRYAEIRRLLRISIRILLIAGILGYALILMSRGWIESLWPEIASQESALIIVAWLVPFSLISFMLQQGLRGFQEIRYMVIGSSVVQFIVKAVLAICFLLLGFHLIGYVSAVVISVIIGSIWMAVGLWRRVRSIPFDNARYPAESLYQWRRYAFVMYANSLVGVATGHLDRFLLGFFAGAGAVGILAVVRTLQNLPVIFLQMLITVVAPMFSASNARNDLESLNHLYHLATDWLVRLSFPLLIFLFLFSGPLLNLYGEEFSKQGQLALITLIVAQCVNLVAGPNGNLLNMCGFERKMFRISVLTMILKAIGLVVLVPCLGLWGASLAIAICVVFINLFCLHLAHYHLHLKWRDPRYFKWIIPGLSSLAVGCFLRFCLKSNGIPMLIIGLTSLYLVFHGISLLQGLHEDDRELLRHWWGKLRPAFQK